MLIVSSTDLSDGLTLTTDCEDDEMIFMSLDQWTHGLATYGILVNSLDMGLIHYNASDVLDIQAVDETINSGEAKFQVNVVYKSQNVSYQPLTTSCVLQPLHKTVILSDYETVTFQPDNLKQRYDGYVFTSFIVRKQYNIDNVNQFYFKLHCGCKKTTGHSGLGYILRWELEPKDITLENNLVHRCQYIPLNTTVYKDFGDDGVTVYAVYKYQTYNMQSFDTYLTFTNGTKIQITRFGSFWLGEWIKVKRIDVVYKPGMTSVRNFCSYYYKLYHYKICVVQLDNTKVYEDFLQIRNGYTFHKHTNGIEFYTPFRHPYLQMRDPLYWFGNTKHTEKVYTMLKRPPRFNATKNWDMPTGIQPLSIRERDIISNKYTIVHYTNELIVAESQYQSLLPTVSTPVPILNDSYTFGCVLYGNGFTELKGRYNFIGKYERDIVDFNLKHFNLVKIKAPIIEDNTFLLKTQGYTQKSLDYTVVALPTTTTTTTTTPTTTTTTTTTTTPTTTTTTTEAPVSDVPNPVCSGDTCQYTISLPLSENMTVQAGNDGIIRTVFECNSNDVICINGTFTSYYSFNFENVSSLTLIGYSNDDVILNQSISINITMIVASISHSTYINETYILHFEQFKNVEQFNGLGIQEFDENGIQTDQYFYPNVTFDQQTNTLIIDHSFLASKIYTLNVTLQNGNYFTTIEKILILPQFNFESTKTPSNIPDNAVKFDCAYPVDIKSKFTAFDLNGFQYNWDLLDQIYNTDANSIMHQFPFNNSCYDIHLNISKFGAITALASTNICLEIGINMTSEYEKTVMLGDIFMLNLHIFELGYDSCFLVESPLDSNEITVFTKADSTTDDCSNRGLTTNKVISNQDLNPQEDGSFLGIYQLLFDLPGDYELKMVAVNNVTSQLETAIISVINMTCRSPEIEILGLGDSIYTQRQVMKSENLKADSRVQINCNSSMIYKAEWTVFTGDYQNETVELPSTIDVNQLKLIIESNTLSYGLYKICLKVQMQIEERFQDEECGFIDIIPSPLEPIISGGDQLNIPWEEPYILDATLSRDPDSIDLRHVEMYFLCRIVVDEEFNLTYSAVKMLSIRKPDLNHTSSNNSQTTEREGCYGNGVGRLETLSSATKVWLDAQHIQPGITIEVILGMYSSIPVDEPRWSTFKQQLIIMANKPPLVKISHIRNADRYMNHDKEQVFQGFCESNCDGKLTFEWTLHACVNDSAKCEQIPTDQMNGILKNPGANSIYYHAKASAYTVDRWYLVMFRAYRDNATYGEVSFRFFVNKNPHSGSCKIEPTSGIVLEDTFKISCSDWLDQHQPLSYNFFAFNNGITKPFCDGQFAECNTVLPIGNATQDYQLIIFVKISDNLGGSIVSNLTVNVGPNTNNSAALDSVKSIFSSTNGTNLAEDLISSGDYSALANLADACSSIVNNQISNDNVTGNLTKEEQERLLNEKLNRMSLRNDIYNQVSAIPLDSIENINTVTASISTIFDNPYEISQETQSKANELMNGMMNAIESLENVDVASESLTNILDISSKMLKSNGAVANVNDQNNTDIAAMKSEGAGLEKSKELIAELESKLQASLDILTKFAVPGSEPVVIETKDSTLGSSKLPQSTNGSSVISAGGIGTKFDQSMIMGDQNLTSDYERAQNSLTVQVRKTINPFTYDVSASKVKSSVTGINFVTKSGEKMSVNNTEKPIEIVIKNNALPIDPENVTMGVQPDGSQQNFHNIKLQNESFRAVITPINNVRIQVYLRDRKRPTPDKYLFHWQLPDNSSCSWKNATAHLEDVIDLLVVDAEDVICTRDVYSIFVSDEHDLADVYLGVFHTPPTEESQTHSENQSRRRRSTTPIKDPLDTDEVDEEFCVVIKPPPPTLVPTLPPGEWVTQPPLYTNESLNYSISITKAKCLFWDPVNETWGSNGCVVGIETTPSKTQCLCNHLTDFAGDVMVAPNPIDMDQVFAGLKNLGDNLGVLMVIITLWLLYAVLLVWARRKDRRDIIEEQIITVDCTRDETTQQNILLNIVTGAGFGCGTTANVNCLLTGEKGKTDVIPLRCTGRKLFQSRSTIAIKIRLAKNIGNLTSIRIFHDNSGKSPSWYLRSIFAIDMDNESDYHFVCDSWLAVESHDGQIEKLLTVADETELKQFHLVFASTVSKNLVDGHIWFSVFMRPKNSPFTRVRRLSACLALIFLVMLTNAMFFGAGDSPGSRKIVWLGEFKINFTGIIIGIQSAFIIVPPSILIVEIFRRLGPKKEKKHMKKQQTQRGSIDSARDTNILVRDDKGVEEDEGDIDHVVDTDDIGNRDKTAEQENHKKAKTKKKKKPFTLPNQCQYLAYFLVFASVGSSSLVCFFYSMMWGPRKSNEWLVSMFTGFFQSVLVIQPIKAVVVALLFAVILKKPVKQEVDDKKKNKEMEKVKKVNGEEDEEESLSGDDGIITADEVPIVRPTDSELEKSRKEKIREKITGIVVKDIATYLIFLLIVAKLAYMERDFHSYIYREDMISMLKEATYTKGPKFEMVSNHGYFYAWMRDTLIPGVFAGPWYNDELMKYSGFIDNHESFLVSIPRIRQVRVQKESCPVHSTFSHLINHCESLYKDSDEDHIDYAVAWKNLNMSSDFAASSMSSRKRRSSWTVRKDEEMERGAITPQAIRKRRETSTSDQTTSQYQKMDTGTGGSLRRRKKLKNQIAANGAPIYFVSPEALLPDGTVVSCSDRWEYFTASQLRGFPIVGRTNTYPGSGYVANLGYNEETSWTVLADLHIHNWLDKQTRAVFTEFTVYNANINLFMTAFLYLETLPTGGAFPWADFKIFNGYRYSAKEGLQSLWAEMVFICFIVYFAVVEIRRMLKLKLRYFKSFFNLIEAALMPLYMVMFVLILIRWLTTSANIKTFKENPKDFVSFQYSASADSALMSVIGIVCFLLNIKFLRLLQFAKLFFVIGKVIQAFTAPLMYFMVPFTTYFLLFSWSAHLAFGSYLEEFQTIPRTITSQFLHLLGAADFESMSDARPIVGPMYFLAYSGFMLFVAFNMFMAIICESIDADFDEEFEKQAGDIQVVEYFTKKMKAFIGKDDIDEEIRIDGDEKMDSIFDKLEQTNEKMTDFENCLSKLHSLVESLSDEMEMKNRNIEQSFDDLDTISDVITLL